MYVTAGSPAALVKLCEAPRLIDPTRRDAPGNRPLDKQHLAGIVAYLHEEPNFVIGSVTLYVRKGTIRFEPLGTALLNEPELGTFSIPIDARIWIGDGQHRLRAYEQVLAHSGEADSVVQNLKRSGSPAVFVEEDNPAKIAQDFVDLQHNVKALSSSLGASLDRRLRINALSLELAMSTRLLADKEPGDRIEYLAATLSKLLPRLYSFSSWRWAIGTIIGGFQQRGRRRWERSLDIALAGDLYGTWRARLEDILRQAEQLMPGWRDIVEGKMSVPFFRQKFVLGSAAGLNALAGALHYAMKDPATDLSRFLERAGQVDWRKNQARGASKVFFEGTIVQRGKVISSRPALEEAAKKLHRHASRVTKDLLSV